MKILKLAAAAAIAAGLSFSATAADESVATPSILSNESFSVGYVDAEIADTVDADGFVFEASKQWDSVYGSVQYQKLNSSEGEGFYSYDIDIAHIKGTVGYQHVINSKSVVEIEAGYRFEEIDGTIAGMSDSEDDTFFNVGVNYRYAVLGNFALTAAANYDDGSYLADDGSQTTWSLGAEYDFTENFGLAASFSKSSDVDYLGLQLIYRPSK